MESKLTSNESICGALKGSYFEQQKCRTPLYNMCAPNSAFNVSSMNISRNYSTINRPCSVSSSGPLSSISGIVINFFKSFSLQSNPKPVEKIREFNSAPNIHFHFIPSTLELVGNLDNDTSSALSNLSSVSADSISTTIKQFESIVEKKEMPENTCECTEAGIIEMKKRRRQLRRSSSMTDKSIHCYGQRRASYKNKQEKNRHDTIWNIVEDYNAYSDTEESDLDITEDSNVQSRGNTSLLSTGLQKLFPNLKGGSSAKCDNSTQDFVHIDEIDFPAISVPRKECIESEIDKTRKFPECDSEDSFVIFSNDTPKATPSASPPSINSPRISLCVKFNNLITPTFRKRQISECSEDSIIFARDENDELDYDNDTDDDNYDDDDSCCDDETDVERESSEEDEVEAHHLDSGFEEKTIRNLHVKFNLEPEVHVMRAWDYAYRQARIGKWEEAARDRDRFKCRVNKMERILTPIMDNEYRQKIYNERFVQENF